MIGRSIIIIFVPLIILVLLAFVFYQTSWNIISKLAESVVADINVLVKLIDDDLPLYAKSIANKDFKMEINILENKVIDKISYDKNRGILSKRLNNL